MKYTFAIAIILSIFPATLFNQQRTDAVRPKVGLVLSGGGALGFAHVGALRVIDSLNIPIDYVAGTSFGGLITGLYAIGYRSDTLQKIVKETDWLDLFDDQPKRNVLPYAEKKYIGRYHIRLPLKGITPTPPSGVIAGQKISLLLSRFTYQYSDVLNFDSLPVPFRCVGVDLLTGNQVVIDRGPLARALRATMALPTAFAPVEYGDSLLSDGGLLNNYPVDVVKAMGADIVIGVDVSGYKFSRTDAKDLFKVMDRASSIPRYQNQSEFVRLTDIYIDPQVDGYTIADFDRSSVDRISVIGYEAAKSKLDTLIKLKNYLDTFSTDEHEIHPMKPKSGDHIIHGVQIVGNEQLDFQFIYSLLNIVPGTLFSTDLIDKKITDVYALGYFETITYATQQMTDSSVVVVISVDEKLFRELNIGLRYDDFYQLVGIVGVRSTNTFLAGLRFESEMQVAGLFSAWGKLSYPSRSLDLPIYPFLIARYNDVPLNVHGPELVLQYKEREASVGFGFGATIDKPISIEVEFNDVVTNIISKTLSNAPKTNDHLRTISSTMDIDDVDDTFIPRQGTNISAQIEHSNSAFGSDFNYTKLNVSAKHFVTPAPLHTVMIGASFHRTYDSPPFYKQQFIGGPDQFVGADYMQITGSKFIVGQIGYRFEYKRDIFLKCVVNLLVDPNYINPVNPTGRRTRYGFGVGIMFTSILGPIEILIARGEKSYVTDQGSQQLIHFSAGMKF